MPEAQSPAESNSPRGADEVPEAKLYLDRNMAEAEVRPIADGEAVVYSARAPGEEQRHNEDTAAVIPFPEGGVLAVADGVGGGPAGERAAGLAVEALESALAQAAREGAPTRGAILNAFEHANHQVLELGGGAGATLAVVELAEGCARPYHVGDSLILIVGQRGKRKLQTVSHSPVGYGVEAGLIDERDALHHEDLHIVSNTIGAADMRIEIGPRVPLAARDTLLLASDGLTDNVHAEEIIKRVRTGPLRSGVQRLAATAQSRMRVEREGRPSKPDDLTVIVFRRASVSRRTRR